MSGIQRTQRATWPRADWVLVWAALLLLLAACSQNWGGMGPLTPVIGPMTSEDEAEYRECLEKLRNPELAESSYLYDRNGVLLATIYNPNEGFAGPGLVPEQSGGTGSLRGQYDHTATG